MTPDRGTSEAWARAFAHVIDAAHTAVADQLATTVDGALGELGLGADVYLGDAAQRALVSMGSGGARQLDVEGTLAGRAYQLGEILPGTDDGARVLWVPVLDGTDRLGVLRVELDPPGRRGDPPAVDGPALHRWLFTLAGLVGHIVATKFVYSDRMRRWRGNGPLTVASELLWQLLPPLTFATDRIVVSAILEPHHEVAGDAFDYNVDGDVVDLAVFDAAGHDLRACMTTALAITAVRNARRGGEEDLVALAARADELIMAQPGPLQFATAVLARIDTSTGVISVLNAGHPPPLLVRGGKVVKELSPPPRLPLGVEPLAGRGAAAVEVLCEQLEPGDRLLFHTDGVTEARDSAGEFFGDERLVELTEHAAATELPAPEMLRRLVAAVLEHQNGELQDDATLLLAEWSPDAYLRMYPTAPAAAVDR